MTDNRSPPPGWGACLDRPYSSSQKGGTIIASEVGDLATHERWMRSPGLYRPRACLRCAAGLHIHDYRPRQLRSDPGASTEIVRFRCSDTGCAATWQVLPAFIARHLWRSWRVVEAVVMPSAEAFDVPETTQRRWLSRLRLSARALVVLLAMASSPVLDALVRSTGLGATRGELVTRFTAVLRPPTSARLAELAELIHRLEPGMRLM